ncbi:MAG: glycosyltransferase family 2 protein [Solirubrobacteraceae bacterium]
MDISIVIPLFNEQDSLDELTSRLDTVLKKYTYEIIYIDDGSIDNSWLTIETLAKNNINIKAIKFSHNFGKTQALNAGFAKAQGEIVFTMDSDLQDFPEEIPEMYQIMLAKNYDILSGWKLKRQDPVLTKNIPSKLFNYVARMSSGIKIHDFNCGLKAYKKVVVKSIELYGDMHRYIPILAKNNGFNKIGEKLVKHTTRKHGVSKFGSKRFINGFLDLITLLFVSKFANKPMHFFGTFGILTFVLGFFSAFYIGMEKLIKLFLLDIPEKLITTDPWFYISLTLMIIGTQFFLAGFISELINNSKRKHLLYSIQEYINFK